MKVGYLRISKEDALKLKESESITNQKKLILDFAKNNDFKIDKFYIDDGYSGGNFDRPSFKEMINDIKEKKIDTVITKDISRLGRDFIETSQYIYKFFPENNIRYIAILENFDTLNPNGVEDIIPFKTIINDMYLKDISKKIKSIRHNKMREGKYMGSTVPYGFKRDKSNKYTFEIDEYASGVVKNIFNMKISGMSNLRIAEYLTKSCILPPSVYNLKNITRTSSIYIWKASTVEKILTNEIYVGTMIQNMVSNVSYKSKKRVILNKDKWIKVNNAVPKIIDINTFNSVQNIINIKKRTRENKYRYLLKGLVICKECQSKMLVRRKKVGKADFAYYCCRSNIMYGKDKCQFHYIRESDLNEIVFSSIVKVIKNFSIDEDIFKTVIFTKQNEIKEDLILLQKNLDTLSKTLSNVYYDYTQSKIKNQQFNILRDEISRKKDNCKKEMEILKDRLAKIEENISNEEYRKQIISDFINLKNVSEDMIYSIMYKVEIDKNRNIYIYF